MIKITCRKCNSPNIRKNGHTKSGRQKCHSRDCNFYSTLNLKKMELEEKSELIEKLYQERLSQKAISRITGISHPILSKILKKSCTSDR